MYIFQINICRWTTVINDNSRMAQPVNCWTHAVILSFTFLPPATASAVSLSTTTHLVIGPLVCQPTIFHYPFVCWFLTFIPLYTCSHNIVLLSLNALGTCLVSGVRVGGEFPVSGLTHVARGLFFSSGWRGQSQPPPHTATTCQTGSCSFTRHTCSNIYCFIICYCIY